MIVFECADKLPRLYAMSVYCLEDSQYIRVLETKMLPFSRRDFQANFVFKDDNAPRVMDFLENENVQHMYGPAMSPDLNPIENLWSEISHGLNNTDNPQQTWLN
jgi:transposase